MIIKYLKDYLPHYLMCLVLWILIVIGTFPANEWSISPGIDPPISWVYNYFFETGLAKSKNIIFPHGPLAFLMYPLQENILLSTLITSLFKGIIVVNIYWLAMSNTVKKWLITFLFAYLISTISGFNHLILCAILLLYCNYYETRRVTFKMLAIIITAFALYVKAYVGIVSIVMFFSFTLFFLYENRKIKQCLIDYTILIFSLLLIWLLMYGSISGFYTYFVGMSHLAKDNSSAAAYYPYNNWFLLTTFFIIIGVIFIINRSKSSLFYFSIVILSLFAAWKHGMAREDIYHVKGFYVYVIICLSILSLLIKKHHLINLTLSILAVFILSINMKNSVNYKESSLNYNFFNGNNFYELITEFSSLKKTSKEKIKKSIETQKLTNNMLAMISKSSVDIYPWDYSIIAANNLNWQPRIVLQSYASYTTWLDKQNADHFSSELAPDYLILEREKISNDINAGKFNSIDGRYLLNDEPQTIIELLKSYETSLSDKKFQLFKKRKIRISTKKSTIRAIESRWRNWIKIPKTSDGLLRAKLVFNKTTIQKIKSFLYKDERFWIYLKLSNGLIHKYRIVPKNAADGIWLNPYLFNLESSYIVDSIMFVASNQNILTEKIQVNFEKFTFDEHPNRIHDFFEINSNFKESILISSLNNFENKAPGWSFNKNNKYVENAFSGPKSDLVYPNSYSSTFTFSLDSIPFDKFKINTECWIKAENHNYSNNVRLVLSVENNFNNIWKGISIDQQIIDENEWNHVFNSVIYNHNTNNSILKCYVFNNSDQEILIDDFKITIIGKNKL